jgi:hypothetical protein
MDEHFYAISGDKFLFMPIPADLPTFLCVIDRLSETT